MTTTTIRTTTAAYSSVRVRVRVAFGKFESDEPRLS